MRAAFTCPGVAMVGGPGAQAMLLFPFLFFYYLLWNLLIYDSREDSVLNPQEPIGQLQRVLALAPSFHPHLFPLLYYCETHRRL